MLKDIIFRFIKQHPWLIAINMCFMLLVPINEIFLPYLYGKVINNIIGPQGITTITILAITLVALQIGYLFRDKINEIFVPALEGYVKTEIIDLILQKYEGAFENLTTGDLVYKLTKIPDVMIYWFQLLNDTIIPYILVFLTAIIYFIRYDWMIATAFVIFLVSLFVVFSIVPKVCSDHAKKNDTVFSNLHEKIEDIRHNMPSIYSANTKPYELSILNRETQNYSSIFAKTATCVRNFRGALIPLVSGLVLFFLLRSKFLIGAKRIKMTYFVPTFVVLTSMLSSIFWIIDIMRYGVFDLGVIANMNEMLQLPPAPPQDHHITTTPNNRPPHPNDSIIGLQNVTFGYSNDNVILKDKTIHFKTNKISALVGNIGAGKSTMLKLLLAFYRPTSGNLYINSHWYKELTISDIRSQIGFVPQTPILFNNTVEYNIKYGNPEVQDKDIHQTLDELKLPRSFLNRHAGKNGNNLSGGQRQLLRCLRVFFKNPKIILMDETTASMDRESKDILLYMLTTLMKDKTIIMVTHDPYLLNYVDEEVGV